MGTEKYYVELQNMADFGYGVLRESDGSWVYAFRSNELYEPFETQEEAAERYKTALVSLYVEMMGNERKSQ